MSAVEEFEVHITSSTVEGQAVQERIVNLLEQNEFTPRDVFSVRLALEEALVNAIKHGNQMDPAKKVRIGCRLEQEKVWIEIEDQGEGFDPLDVPDPTTDDNLERPCGRGVMLIKAFMTSVTYNDSGNCIIMEKVRGDESDDE